MLSFVSEWGNSQFGMVGTVVLFIIGLVALIKGGDWFVDGATGIAKKFHIPELLIGATVVSIGTTLPEVMVSATDAVASLKNAGAEAGIAYGNAIGSVIWAIILPKIPGQKLAYALSLIIGGIGFILVPFVHDQYLLFLPYLLIGCAWAAMLAMPFAIVTNALQGYGHMGVYLGLFNGTICVPQIAAAALGGVILSLVGSVQGNMLIIAGLCLVIGALCVGLIKTSQASKE